MRAKIIIFYSIVVLCVLIVAGSDDSGTDKEFVAEERPEFEVGNGKSESSQSSEEESKEAEIETEPDVKPLDEEDNGDAEPEVAIDPPEDDDDNVEAKEVIADITKATTSSSNSDKHTTSGNSTDNDLAIHVQFEDDPSADVSKELKLSNDEPETETVSHPADQVPPQPKDEVLIRRQRENDSDEVELSKDDETIPERNNDEAELTKEDDPLAEEDPIPTTVSTKVYAIKVDKPLKESADNANTSYGPTVSLLDGPGIEEVGFESEDLPSEADEVFANMPAEALSITKRKRSGKNGTDDESSDSSDSDSDSTSNDSSDSRSSGSIEFDKVPLPQSVRTVIPESARRNITIDEEEVASETGDDGKSDLPADEHVENLDDEAELKNLIDGEDSSEKAVSTDSEEEPVAKVPLPQGIRTVIPESRRRNVSTVYHLSTPLKNASAETDDDDTDLVVNRNDATDNADNGKNLDEEAELHDDIDTDSASVEILYPEPKQENATINDKEPEHIAPENSDEVSQQLSNLEDEGIVRANGHDKILDDGTELNFNSSADAEILPNVALKLVDTVLTAPMNSSDVGDFDSEEAGMKERIDDAFSTFKDADTEESNSVPKKDVLSDPRELKLESIESTESDETAEFDEPIFIGIVISGENDTDSSSEEAAGIVAANTKKIGIVLPVLESADSDNDDDIIQPAKENTESNDDDIMPDSDDDDDDVIVAASPKKTVKSSENNTDDDVIEASDDKNYSPYHVESEPESDEEDTKPRVVEQRVEEPDSSSASSEKHDSSDYDVLDKLRDDVDEAEKAKNTATDTKADDETSKSSSQTEEREEAFSIHRPSYRYMVASDAGTEDAIIIKETRNRRQAIVSNPVEVRNRHIRPFEIDEMPIINEPESDDNDSVEYSPNDVKVAEMLKSLADAMEKDLELNDEPIPDSQDSESFEHHRSHHGFAESASQERFHHKNFKIFPQLESEIGSDSSKSSESESAESSESKSDSSSSSESRSYSSEEASTHPENAEDEDYEPIVIPMDLPADDRNHLLSHILGLDPKDGPVMIEPEGVRNGFGPGTNQNIDEKDDILSNALLDDDEETGDEVMVIGAKTAVIEITKKITLMGDEADETSIQAPPIEPDQHERDHEAKHQHDKKNFNVSVSISPFMLVFVVIVVIILVCIKLLYTHCVNLKTSDPRPPIYTIAPTNSPKGSSNIPKEVIIDSKVPIV